MRFCLMIALLLGFVSPVVAQEYAVGSYTAFIGPEDLANSRGVRLGDAVQVLRQDRANVYRYGIVHPGDEREPWFFQPEARTAMAGMFRAGGGVDPATARLILNGNVLVRVTIYAKDGNFTSLRVEVLDAAGSGMHSDAPAGGSRNRSLLAEGIVPPGPGPDPDMGCQVRGLDPGGDGFLAIRAGPGTKYRQIGQLRNGDAAFLAVPCQGHWCYVENGAIDGKPATFRGWIHDAWCLFYP